ncbi:hypothetical protein CAPTEDRAFT_210535 [Capitella teleta]|uniref:CG-1 domain-containing protein n=1 Tax=Capitella teleta TaxID=283909 RepID=R7TPW2_CAPTE|nr:hypothetical protein CAPTEDRAFT_210535 [Capitella teleta]|eukprot:ELT95607.1 hypothetical protein CAPTEDRAFT_210535 [Capitella teleta]
MQNEYGRWMWRLERTVRNAAVHGESGWSSYWEREVKAKVAFVVRVLEEDGLVARVGRACLMEIGVRSKWWKKIGRMTEELGVDVLSNLVWLRRMSVIGVAEMGICEDERKRMKKVELERRVQEVGRMRWEEQLQRNERTGMRRYLYAAADMAQSKGCICYCTIKSQILISKAASLINDIDETKITQVPPTSPENGSVYIYKSDSEPNDQWKNDGSNWVDTGSVKLSTDDNPLVVKSFHFKDEDGKPSKKFIRTVYCNENKPTIVLVHYLRQDEDEEVTEVTENSEFVSCSRIVVKQESSVAKPLPVVYGRNNTGINGIPPKEAHVILKNFDICKLSPIAPYRPLPGELYVYRIPESGDAKEFWRKDGYSWFSEGRKTFVVNQSNMVKSFFRICLGGTESANLFRHVYHLIESPEIVLVHYLGSSSIARSYSTPPTIKALSKVKIPTESPKSHTYNTRKRKPEASKEIVEQKAVVYAHRDTLLSNKEAHTLLISIDPSKFSTASPVRPAHGEIFAFRSESTVNNDWVYDGYDWIDRGIQQIKVGNTFLVKMVFLLRTSPHKERGPNFVKHAYFALNNPLNVLLHYLGATPYAEDEEVAVQEREEAAQYLFIENGKVVLRPKEISNPKLKPDDQKVMIPLVKEPLDIQTALLESIGAFNSSAERKADGSVVYYKDKSPLPNSHVIIMLRNIDLTKISLVNASRPNPDEIYVYKFDKSEKVADDYAWKNCGLRRLPTKDPVFLKGYFEYSENGLPSKKFIRHVYRLIDDESTVMVHYVGQKVSEEAQIPPTIYLNYDLPEGQKEGDADALDKSVKVIVKVESNTQAILGKLLNSGDVDSVSRLTNGAICYTNSSEGLTFDEAYSLLKNVIPAKVSKVVAFYPEGSEIFIYKFESSLDLNVWKHDGYSWMHAGLRRYPKTSPFITKAYFQYCERKGKHKSPDPMIRFTRHMYFLTEDPLTVLVHYIGERPSHIVVPDVNNDEWVDLSGEFTAPNTSSKQKASVGRVSKHESRQGWKSALRRRRLREAEGEEVTPPVTQEVVENPDQIRAMVYATCEDSLEVPTVLNLLAELDETRVSQVPPFRPTHGQVFVFKFESPQRRKDWTCDGYTWVSMGNRKYPKDSAAPTFVKSYYQIRGAEGKRCKDFVRYAFHAIDDPLVVVVQYLGDESAYVPHKHGNRKRDDVIHQRTCPSTLAALREKSATLKPQELYTMMSKISVLPPAMTPRDSKQVSNIRRQVLRQNRELKVKEETDTSVWELMTMQVVEEQEVEGHIEQVVAQEQVVESASPPKKKKKSPLPKKGCQKSADTNQHDCLANFSGLNFDGTGSPTAYLSRVEAAGRLMGYEENRLIDIVLMTISDEVFDAWYNPVSHPGDTPGDKYAWTEWKNYFLSKYKLIEYE